MYLFRSVLVNNLNTIARTKVCECYNSKSRLFSCRIVLGAMLNVLKYLVKK